MHIVLKPFINHHVELVRCEEPQLDGTMVMVGRVNGSEVRITVHVKEAAKMQGWFREHNVAELALAL